MKKQAVGCNNLDNYHLHVEGCSGNQKLQVHNIWVRGDSIHVFFNYVLCITLTMLQFFVFRSDNKHAHVCKHKAVVFHCY